jgi:C4-dicarboxylate transporter DctM subunit
MPVIILGGIYGGIFTPTEASVVAVFYALIHGHGDVPRADVRDLVVILRKSGDVSSAVIMFIIANAGLFAYLITRAGVPDAIGGWLQEVLQVARLVPAGCERGAVLIGMFIETSAAIIVLAPILAPVARALRHRPGALRHDHGGQPGLGMITPPFGVNLFAACTVARISLDRIVKPHLLPFVLVRDHRPA